MINHLKTLLANEDSSKSSELGFIIDPSFRPAVITGKLKDAYSALFNTSGMSKRDVLSYVFSVVSRVDLEDMLYIFDKRREGNSNNAKEVFGGFSKDESVYSFEKFTATGTASFLFSRTGDKTTDELLEKLKRMHSSNIDGHMALAALIVALAARLELKRLGGNG